jgi:GNAT superfamily N-acetyltransferase
LKLVVRRLDDEADRDRFDCGVPVLNDWLKHQAGQAERKRLASVWIATTADDPATLVGYYSLAPWQIAFEECPPALRKKLPRYPVAVTLLARLAVARTAQGQGVGAELLVDGLLRAHAASEAVPVQAVVVHAKDDAAATWYRRHGFLAFADRPHHLFLAMETIASLAREHPR